MDSTISNATIWSRVSATSNDHTRLEVCPIASQSTWLPAHVEQFRRRRRLSLLAMQSDIKNLREQNVAGASQWFESDTQRLRDFGIHQAGPSASAFTALSASDRL